MPRRIAQNISLTPEHAAFIADQIALGRYTGISEVLRAALNHLARHDARPAARPTASTDADRT